MSREEQVRSRLRQWIVKNGRGADQAVVGDDTPLIERRIVSSFEIASLLLFIEELRGAPLDPRSLVPGSFRSIDALWTNFFAETPDVPRT